jgi:hypothetical protein
LLGGEAYLALPYSQNFVPLLVEDMDGEFSTLWDILSKVAHQPVFGFLRNVASMISMRIQDDKSISQL